MKHRWFLLFAIILMLVLWLFYLAYQMVAIPKIDNTELVSINHQMENGEYLFALENYKKLVKQGVVHENVFFNMGNAAYQLGKIGEAIAAYRQAKDISPRDVDIQANLSLSREKRTDQLSQELTGVSIFSIVAQPFSTNELAVITLLAWYMVFMLIFVAIGLPSTSKYREIMFYLVIFMVLIAIIISSSFGVRLYEINYQNPAVVIVSEVGVHSGPGKQYTIQFKLHDGAELNILEKRTNWVRVELEGSNMQGWIEDVSLLSFPKR